ADARPVELVLDLLRRVDQYIRAVDEQARAAPAVRQPLGARLHTDAAVAAGPGRRDRATGAEEFDPHAPPAALPAERVGDAARVGAAGQGPPLAVDPDGADAAGLGVPVGPGLDVVAALGQPGEGRLPGA